MSVLDKVRRWIDGESAEMVLEEAARNAQVKPRSQAEEFIVKIARAVEQVMQEEMVPLPQGTTIIPSEYIIFLSNDDDKEWQGIKRRGLEQGLHHILTERAREIAGQKKLEVKSFVVELRVDGTLNKGDIRVQHSWEDTLYNKTSVIARPKMPSENPAETGRNYQPTSAPNPEKISSPNFTNSPQAINYEQSVSPQFPDAQPHNAQPRPTQPQFQNEELTHVKKRRELYNLEVFRNGTRQQVIPVYDNQVVIGRGSMTRPVDVTLTGDPEISRRHLVLFCDRERNFFIVNEGRNPAFLNNVELPLGKTVPVTPGMPISICSYSIRIQPTVN